VHLHDAADDDAISKKSSSFHSPDERGAERSPMAVAALGEGVDLLEKGLGCTLPE